MILEGLGTRQGLDATRKAGWALPFAAVYESQLSHLYTPH